MRNLAFGSYNAPGKKNRRNMSRLTLGDPSTAAITNLRRRAITFPGSASSDLVKMFRKACARDGLAASFGGADPGVSDVEFAILSPGRFSRPSIVNRDPSDRETQLWPR